MTRYRHLRRADTRQKLDRATWADLDKLKFDLEMIGAGEYLTEEPVYFGHAFDAPPTFSYSAVGRTAVTGNQEVKALSYPPAQAQINGKPEGWYGGADVIIPVYGVSGGNNEKLAQAFKYDGKFDHVVVYLRKTNSPPDSLTCKIVSSLGGATLLEATNPISGDELYVGSWRNHYFRFPSLFAPDPDTTYYLVFERTGTGSLSHSFNLGEKTTTEYTNGNLWELDSSTWTERSGVVVNFLLLGAMDQLQHDGWIADGSFEHQMIYNDPYIPEVGDQNYWDYYQKINNEQGLNTWEYLPFNSNTWVQSGSDTCREPLRYGDNIARDPGAEQQLVYLKPSGGGPGGNEIPYYKYGTGYDLTSEHEWSDNTYTLPYSFAYRTFSTVPTITTTDPLSGTRHLTLPDSNGFIFIHQTELCSPIIAGKQYGHWTTGRCQPGDTITLTINAKAPGTINGGILYIEVIGRDGDDSQTWSQGYTPTSSYAPYTITQTMPATDSFGVVPYAFNAYFSGRNVYIDDISIKVERGGDGTEEDDGRWFVTDDRAYPNERGYKSRYSAKYVFGGDPNSRWLIPMHMADQGNCPYYYWQDPDPYEAQERDIWCAMFPRNEQAGTTLQPGGYLVPAFNPPDGNLTFELAVVSDGPCTLEANIIHWDDHDTSFWGPAKSATYPSIAIYYRELKNETFTSEVGTTWQLHQFETQVDPHIYPNYPPVPFEENPSSSQFAFVSAKFRITGGVPGQQVWIDEVHAWPDLTSCVGAPFMTIGVAEWIQDEQDMYVGCHLWFKVGPCDVVLPTAAPASPEPEAET